MGHRDNAIDLRPASRDSRMPAEKTLAIVVRLVEFSETSVVATLFTRDFGKITALAKGARRPKGPFEAALDLLAVCRIVFLRKSSGALHLLTEAKLERRFRAAARDLSRLYAGFYVAELLRELTDEDDPHPELFDEALHTLAALDDGGPVPLSLVRFELAALRLVGHLPSLAECVGCGASVEPTGRIAFGQIAGGVLCPKCRSGQRSVVSMSSEAIALMRRVAASEPWDSSPWPEVGGRRSESGEQRAEVSPADVDRKLLGEIRGLLNNYLAHHVGHKLNMHPFISRGT